MPIIYKKLFHELVERDMKKGELQEKAGITASIMARLAKDETVRTDTIGKICKALECQPGDIMEYIDDDERSQKKKIDEQIIELLYDTYKETYSEIPYYKFKSLLLKCVKGNPLTGTHIDQTKLNGLLKDEVAKRKQSQENEE